MKFTFNTGCHYTAEGQVITVSYEPENERVLFYDHSRGINGAYRISGEELQMQTEYQVKEYLMFRYLRGGYEYNSDAANLERCS